ncbi:putative DNA helicase [Helianthus annuus]|nr:putative DNA helicase [Helianthus annuus]
MDSNNHVSDLIDFVYPSIIQNFSVATFFQERAILAPTMNEVVDEINDRLLSLVPGDEKEYLSFDSICESENRQEGFDQSLYSPDVLNGLKISGLPHHRLVLKVGVPVMLLRNIDQRNGLCNGTRLKVLMLGSRVIEAEVISGSNIGKRTFIPRIALTPSDKKIPFKLKRRQFPIVVCFAMTINKSQGQSLSKVGLFLRQPVFSHCQLYVTLSRVKSRDGLKLVIVDKDGKLTNTTLNVVYKEVFRDL